MFAAAAAKGGAAATWSRDAALDFESLWNASGLEQRCGCTAAGAGPAARHSPSPPRAPARLSASGSFKLASAAGACGTLQAAESAGALAPWLPPSDAPPQ